MIVLVSDGPSDAAITSAITSSGSDCMMSMSRCTSRSNQPPKKPEASPIPDAEETAEEGCADRHRQRNARTEDEARNDVPAHEIGAEDVARRQGRASEDRALVENGSSPGDAGAGARSGGTRP
jgi:hypothetical protein